MDQQAPRTHGLIIQWAARYDLLAWMNGVNFVLAKKPDVTGCA